MARAVQPDDQTPSARVEGGTWNGQRWPRTTLIILAVLAAQCLAYIIRTADQLNRPSVGGAGLVLAILVCQLALYAIVGLGLWQGRRWAVAATAVVLAGETAWALLVSVSNDLYTPYFMILAVLSVAALVALVPAGARSVRGKADA